MKHYTVYKITNKINGKYYLGAHETYDLDDGYMGSGKIITKAIKKYGLENFDKEYLYFAESSSEMYLKEASVIGDRWKEDPMCYNQRAGGNGGWSHIDSAKQNKGKVVCKNDNGEYFSVSVENFNSTQDLTGIKKGQVTCKEKDTNKTCSVTTDEFNSNYNLVGVNTGIKESEETRHKKSIANKGKFTAYDTTLEEFVYVSTEEFNQNDNIITSFQKYEQMGKKPKRHLGKDHHLTTVIEIFDNTGKLKYTSDGAFGKFCQINNLPHGALAESYKNSGEPIYTKTRPNDLPKLVKKGFDKYIGWYAKRKET